METLASGNDSAHAKRKGACSVSAIARNIKRSAQPQGAKRKGGSAQPQGMPGRAVLFLLIVLALAPVEGAVFASDAKEIYDKAMNASYNLDFNGAERGYETLTQEYPDNPDYWNALASVIWLKTALSQQKLNLESFSGRTLGTRDSRDSVDPAEEKRFRETIAVAIQKADAILSKNPNDVDALYAKGIANGTLGSFEATIKRSYVAAYTKARVAHDLHEQVLKLDPMFDDAELSIGAYDYVIGVIPTFVRFLLAPLGVRSAGKDVGIQELEKAAANGKVASTDAKMILTVVYTRERQYEQALQVYEGLHAQYPGNFAIRLAEASVYGKMQKWDEADRIYQEVLEKILTKKDGYDRLRQARVFYALGANDIASQQFEKAIDAFSRVVSGNDATQEERARAYLWLGKLFDSKKDRLKAVEQYDALLVLNCSPDLKTEALRYKRRPYGE
jgi:tetratricopeptide (TPR) repeat protein